MGEARNGGARARAEGGQGQVGVGRATEGPGCAEAKAWWMEWGRGMATLPMGRGTVWCEWGPEKDRGGGAFEERGREPGQSGHGRGWVIGLRWELAGALTHLLQLQPHFVEGSQPVGLGPGHGILTFLAFLIFFGPETEARGILRHQGWLSLHPPPSTL